MSTEPKLEAYLNALDKALGQIPVSDRAEIVMEIKSHVLDSMERNKEQSISSVLDSLGEPETVANRYLMERGLKVSRPPKTPMVKWLTVGFLGTLGIFAFLLIVLVWKFTPFVSVSEDRVKILGGLIDINGEESSSTYFMKSSEKLLVSEGSRPVGSADKQVSVIFTNGAFDLSFKKEKELKWKCHGGSPGIPDFSEKAGNLQLDFQKLEGMTCTIQFPIGIKSRVQGVNGQLQISRPRSDLEVRLDNGQIQLSPDPQQNYHYEIHVVNGYSDRFSSADSSSKLKDSVGVKIDLTNGYIKNGKL